MNTQLDSTATATAEIVSFRENTKKQDDNICRHLVPLLPPVDRPERIYQVWSDAMSPEYPVGSVVGAKKIKLPTPFILWGETYLIDTANYGTIMRRINTSDIPGCIRCYAANPNYDPIDLSIDSILQIFKITVLMKLV